MIHYNFCPLRLGMGSSIDIVYLVVPPSFPPHFQLFCVSNDDKLII